jgi:hypothetical protein
MTVSNRAYANPWGVMTGFAKLWSSILHSTVWQEPLHVKVTWVTMLALSDARGYVGASIPGLANAAGVTIEQCEESLAKFMAPDPYSRTKDFEGRRIFEEDGGWRIINYGKHRAARAEEERRIQNREAQQRHRKRRAVSNAADSKPRKPRSAQAEAEAEADTETTKSPLLSAREAENVEIVETQQINPDSTAREIFLQRVPERQLWEAEINAMLAGMPGHYHATEAQIETACGDMIANGKAKVPNLRQFRRYVEGAINEKATDSIRTYGRSSPWERSLATSAELFREKKP